METDSLIDYIRKVVPVSENDVQRISGFFKPRQYLKDQYILQAGDICEHENFVVKGCAKAFHITPDGKEHVLMFAVEDWWIGDLGSFTDKTPSDLHIKCLENCLVLQISRDNMNTLQKEVPNMERFFRIIIQRAFVASQKRIIDNLSLAAVDRYENFRAKYPGLEQRIPQYMIASYLGMSKEFLSKIRSESRSV